MISRFLKSFVLISLALVSAFSAPDAQSREAREPYELTQTDYAWQAAALKNLSMRDLIWMEIAACNSQFGGSSEQILREYHATMDLLAAQSPDQAFWLKPATAQNVASATTILSKITDVASAGPSAVVGARISAILGIFGEGALIAGRTTNDEDRVERSMDSSIYAQLAPNAADVVERYLVSLRTNPNSAIAHDGSELATRLMLYSTDNKTSIFARHSDLVIRNLLEGEVIPSLTVLRAQVGQTNALLAEIVAANDAQIRQQQWQERIAATGVAIDVISRMIGRSDPKVARQVAGIGGAALKVADLVYKLKKSGAQLGTAGLALGVAGIAGSLIGSFMDSGPSADEIILEQLAALSSQIEDLRFQMHERFDRVDARLDQLVQISISGIALVRQDLASVALELKETQRQIADLKWEIERAETNLSRILRAGFARDLIASADRCLGVLARTGVPMTYNEFTACESALFLAASSYSFDDVALAAEYDQATPDHLLGTFLDGGGANNARFLFTLLAARFGHTLRIVPNAEAWASAADAYTTLLRENPVHATRIAHNRRAMLVAQGDALHDSLALLTVNSDGSANAALWNSLVAFATSKHAVLDRALESAEKRAVARLSETAQVFDLWGGPDQPTPTSLDTAISSMKPCADGNEISVPPDIIQRWLINAVRNAAVMAGHEVLPCWKAQYVQTRSVSSSGGEGAGFGLLQIDFQISAGGVTLASRRYVSDTEYLIGSGGRSGGQSFPPSHYVEQFGPSLQAAYVDEAIDLLMPEQSRARDEAARAYASSELRSWRAAFHTAVAGEVSQPGDSFNAAEALAAAPRLLRAVLRLSDTSALQRDQLLALFGAELPALGASAITTRYASTVLADDLFHSVRGDLGTEVDAWARAASARVQAYVIERAALTPESPDFITSPADGALLSLSTLVNGPVNMDPNTPWALFPMLRLEAMSVSDEVVADARWVPADLPPRFDPVTVWNLSVEGRTEGQYRVCVEPQGANDLVAVFDGIDWLPLPLDPTAEWLCGSTDELPAQVALTRVENAAPRVECANIHLTGGAGASITLTSELIAPASDDDDDLITMTLKPSMVSAPGRYEIEVVATDAWGSEASCTATVVVDSSPSSTGSDGAGGDEVAMADEPGEQSNADQPAGAATGDAKDAVAGASNLTDGDGCGCRLTRAPGSTATLWLVLGSLTGIVIRRQRRNRSERSTPS